MNGARSDPLSLREKDRGRNGRAKARVFRMGRQRTPSKPGKSVSDSHALFLTAPVVSNECTRIWIWRFALDTLFHLDPGILDCPAAAPSVSGYFKADNQLPWYAIPCPSSRRISSEQFVGEVGYAYKLGMPIANWEWLVFPSLTILLWIFVPLCPPPDLHHAQYLEQGSAAVPDLVRGTDHLLAMFS